MTKLEALVCKFGTKYPSAYGLMKDALVCLRRMGMVRSHYFATHSPIQNSSLYEQPIFPFTLNALYQKCLKLYQRREPQLI